MLKYGGFELTIELSHLYSMIMFTREVPQEWKSGITIPIYIYIHILQISITQIIFPSIKPHNKIGTLSTGRYGNHDRTLEKLPVDGACSLQYNVNGYKNFKEYYSFSDNTQDLSN